ncbi:MAG: sulfatase-like hydrolase/transferase [Candidatus Lokiarchaeota archaeon]|nr:sulfatase-like hydrolase/transferase [Candidatus Lokiarchaeota archaeon]MBD3337460.1 sulfatase-like hydrolase/transferase [Candidatus Lokiarchaeota archaeon]
MERPNFLIFISDQHRGDWMPYEPEVFKELKMESLPLTMPNIRNIMSEGITFTNAITPSPLCAPARACLAAGVRYKDCRVKGNHENYPLDQKTYYSILKKRGYNVGAVGKLDLHKPTLFWGLNGWLPELEKLGFTHVIDNEGKWDAIRSVIMERDAKGRRRRVKPVNYKPKGPYLKFLSEQNLLVAHVEDFLKRFGKNNLNSSPTPLPDYAYCDNWLTKKGIQMLRDLHFNKPWHLVVNFTGPHDPWDITESMKENCKNTSFPPPNEGSEQKRDEEIKVRQNYSAMLENIDRNIGLILDEVRKRGELENTMVIYTSDHGEMLGDFGKYGKTRPYRGSVKIPLVIAGPDSKKGMYSDALVEMQDLTSTILDYSEASMKDAIGSLSLQHLLEGNSQTHRKFQISALDLSEVGVHEWKMVSDGRYKLIVRDGKKSSLFDVKEDPWENVNVLNENKTIASDLLKKLNNAYL